MKRLFLVGLLCTALLTSGCFGDYPRATVYGEVKYQGEPVTGATVMFLTRDNQVYRAEISADGSYEVAGVPKGQVRVCIQQARPTVMPRPDPPPGANPNKPAMSEARDANWKPPPPIEKGPKIPEKYGDPNQSGLTFDLTQERQQWSIDLK
jgi:hypothetical protein